LLLSTNGVVNFVLTSLGFVDRPIRLMFNWFGVIVSMIHVEIPFMFFPILTVLLQIPPHLREAAKDLGASDLAVWRRVVLPLSLPGVLAGSQIVFTTAISAFASPTILGGGRVQVMPVAIYQNILGLNWPLGAVQSVTLLLLSLILVAVFTRALAPQRSGR
jgi:putative spermidine/putrescine transport system permease protein